MAALLFPLLIVGGAGLSYIEATTVRSPRLRSRDCYNRLPRTSNSLQNREVVVDEAWSRGAEWSQHENPNFTTPVSSCGEGDSFTVLSKQLGDLAGCYIRTGQHNGEALYMLENRMDRKYMVAAINSNETNTSLDVHWTLARNDSLHHDIICISVDSDNHAHPVDTSWTCDFSQRGMVSIAANPNDTTFSCGCTPVAHDSWYKTTYHRRTTENGHDDDHLAVIVLMFLGICIGLPCCLERAQQSRRVVERQIVFVRVPTRRARRAECLLSAETARNTQASAITSSSNEPGPEIEMVRSLRRPGGAANNSGHMAQDEEGILEISQ